MRRVLMVMLLALAACARGAPEIALDIDECRFCRMIISDARFAAAAETAAGRTVRFDSIECLAGWVLAEDQPPRALWVTDSRQPGRLIRTGEARFIRDGSTSSPMGRGWLAVGDDAVEGLDWDALVAQVRREGAFPAVTGTGE